MPSIARVRATFAEAVNQVTYAGERIVIEKRGKPVAALVHIDDLRAIQAREDRRDIAEAKRVLAKGGPWLFWEDVERRLDQRRARSGPRRQRRSR